MTITNLSTSTTSTGMPSRHRVDALQCKAELAMFLGPYAKDRYWHRMRAFIRGQCSRRELDDLASELLVSEHVSLHNRFVRAIHHNVQPFVVPAEAHGGMVAVRSGRDDEAAGFVDGELAQLRSGGLSRRDQRLALDLIRSLSLAELENLQRTGSINGQLTTIIRPQADTLITPRADGSAGGPLLSQRQFRRPRSLLDKDLPSLEFERGVFAPLASEAGALLDYAALKLKMTGVARECELYGPVGDACLLLIHEAVEHYLKNIIGDCITRCRPKTVGNAKSAIGRESATGRESAMAVAATSSSTDNGAVSTTSTITLRDLYFSMKLTGPRLADHGWSLAMERMAAGSMLENLEQGV